MDIKRNIMQILGHVNLCSLADPGVYVGFTCPHSAEYSANSMHKNSTKTVAINMLSLPYVTSFRKHVL